MKNLPGKKFGSTFEKTLWLLSLSRNAIVVITGTIIAYSLSLNNSIPFKITGNITEGLPPFSPPPFSTIFNNKTYTFFDMTTTLGSSIASVPFIAILESIAIGKAFGKLHFNTERRKKKFLYFTENLTLVRKIQIFKQTVVRCLRVSLVFDLMTKSFSFLWNFFFKIKSFYCSKRKIDLVIN